jgi:hypothetical protein
MKFPNKTFRVAICGAAIVSIPGAAQAATFSSATVFATGTSVGGTQPDSVTYGNGSVWIEYGNGASSTGGSGSSTIVQYNTAGAVQNSYSIAGSVDGLKYNPYTGMVWALQNQDGGSQLTILNPMTKAMTAFSYGAPYPSVSGTRGFDDVAFIGNSVYLSFTNPASTTDAVLVKLNSATPSSPIGFSTVLTGAGVLLTDSDSLKSTTAGNLVQTGGADGALTFINNPGTASQTATSLKLAAPGATIGSPDDSIYPTASSGTFYLTDTATNTVYSLFATGLSTSSLYVNVGNEFGRVDLTTGVVTPILSGSSLHGLEFVASSSAVPEPTSVGMSLCGIALALLARKRFAS